MFKKNNLKILFIVLFFIIMFFSGIFYVRYVWYKSLAFTSDQALIVAKTAENALNGEMFKQLRAIPEDVGTIAYESIKTRLMNLVLIDKNIRFAYIYTKREGKIYFLVDSEPTTSKDYSPPGQEFTEADLQVFQPFVDGQALITKPTTDRWGTWVSIFVPMKDIKTGEIKAVFGLDYPAENWKNKAFYDTIQSGIIVLFLFIILFILFLTKKNSLKLKKSEEKYRLLVENNYDVIYILSADGVFTFVSERWTELLGHPTKDVIGQPFQKFIHPDDIVNCMIFMKKVIETGEQQEGLEYRIKHIDGSWHWHTSSVIPLTDSNNKVIGGYGVARDITLQKKEKEELRKTLEDTSKLNKLMIGRELEMITLKKEIIELKNKNEN